jgi:hypothetical protein
MTKNELFPVVDYVPRRTLEALFKLNERVSFEESMRLKHHVRAKWTGEKRCPKKGEWFLSGAIVGGYLATNDLSTPYHIAKLVATETVTITREI